MDRNQIEAALKEVDVFSGGWLIPDLATALAAALTPKWIKCSEKMPPNDGTPIFACCSNSSVGTWTAKSLLESGAIKTPAEWYWQPRYVPDLPKEEENEFSEIIRRLKKLDRHNDYSVGLQWAIDEIKKIESERCEKKK